MLEVVGLRLPHAPRQYLSHAHSRTTHTHTRTDSTLRSHTLPSQCSALPHTHFSLTHTRSQLFTHSLSLFSLFARPVVASLSRSLSPLLHTYLVGVPHTHTLAFLAFNF